MSKLEVCKYGHNILRKKSVEILEITQEIKVLAQDMLETMYAAPGVGLAAPQVGKSIALCVIDVSKEQNKPLVLINPKVVNTRDQVIMQEGCLSFPGMYEDIKRFDFVEVAFIDLEGKSQKVSAEGFLSKALQHEIDHLNAKLFIDYLPQWKRKNLQKEIKRKQKSGQW
ncbi:MAG: peptide deformylase [Elusimicrobiota bacterium]|nr:peptide deformylase [Elusimicrobiota bacterium]